MLFDEPTSALDPEPVGEVLRVMQSSLKKVARWSSRRTKWALRETYRTMSCSRTSVGMRKKAGRGPYCSVQRPAQAVPVWQSEVIRPPPERRAKMVRLSGRGRTTRVVVVALPPVSMTPVSPDARPVRSAKSQPDLSEGCACSSGVLTRPNLPNEHSASRARYSFTACRLETRDNCGACWELDAGRRRCTIHASHIGRGLTT
jgi:hypothetical protein